MVSPMILNSKRLYIFLPVIPTDAVFMVDVISLHFIEPIPRYRRKAVDWNTVISMPNQLISFVK